MFKPLYGMAPPDESLALRPVYELRAFRDPKGGMAWEVWQLPCAATPQLQKPLRIGGLAPRKAMLVEGLVLRKLKAAGISAAKGGNFALNEDVALILGLLFRCLAPMRDSLRMRQVAQGIEAMAQPEAAYWLGMAMYRKNPRRILSALRILLTDPGRKPGP